ncbi:MAG TPA: hypothetical protein ENJ68_06230 [Devosia sp.]|nr:hypothetical protein [Devosia sp.]
MSAALERSVFLLAAALLVLALRAPPDFAPLALAPLARERLAFVAPVFAPAAFTDAPRPVERPFSGDAFAAGFAESDTS